MKPEYDDHLPRRTRQVCILCQAFGKAVSHINSISGDQAAVDQVTVHLEGGDLFEIHRTLRNGAQVVYYQWMNGAYHSGVTVDLNGLLKEVGRQAFLKGFPFNQRWGTESLGYLIGYKEAENLMWTGHPSHKS